MTIKEFIRSENQKLKYLGKKDRAIVLLTSVNNEIVLIDSTKIAGFLKGLSDTVAMNNFTNKPEYSWELQIAKHLLEFYKETETFKMSIFPLPHTERDKERYNDIKDYLESLF